MHGPLLSVVLPVYNEERILAASTERVLSIFLGMLPYPSEVIIAENGSTDRTLEVARRLSAQHRMIQVIHLNQKGRGRVLKEAWSQSQADVLSYMDLDLSTDLSFYVPLTEALVSGDYDLAAGSRLLKSSCTTRCFKREVISRVYNLLVKVIFRTRFSDAQCGFKAITRRAANELLPLVGDDGWFFDTELLVLAEKLGYRIFDLPVRWVEGRDSRVNICRTAFQDIRGLLRLRRKLGRLVRERAGPARGLAHQVG